MNRLATLVFFFVAFAVGCAVAQETVKAPPQGKTFRVLAVGNSFSENATRHLPGLFQAAGHRLILGKATVGGCPLSKHWDMAQAHAKDPAEGLYGPSGDRKERMGLKELLGSEPWDFITIQQYSFISHDVTTYRPHAKNLYDFIKQHAPQAEVLMHETWAYRVDDPRFAGTKKEGEPRSQAEMHAQLKRAYETIAGELKIRVIPSGDAFFAADTDAQMGYRPDARFDRKTAVPPQLPDQTHSLHVGWRWAKKKDSKSSAGQDTKPTLGMDGHHANMAGEYLAGCVFLEVLSGEDVTGNSFVPKGLDPDFARFLRQTAHRTVAKTAAP